MGVTPESIRYPFRPKSNSLLRPGQFWGIPLSDGRFACGRVLQIDRDQEYGKRTTFLAGLMDWCGTEPPTASTIAGAKLLDQGQAHIKTITENGGMILGYRSLKDDGLRPFVCRRYPGLSSWGYKVISILAEKYCVQGRAAR